MKKYICYVYERNRKFSDNYLVSAEDEVSAKAELIRRLDEETDTGSANYDILEIIEYEPR